MTTAGWIFMLISWAVILGLFIFSLFRTLRPPKQRKNQQE
jgi:hypothetical protein